jgi:SAM-dependent methyltransferase
MTALPSLKLNVGCGNLRIPGFVGVDFRPGPAVDVVCDLARAPWPFRDACAGEVRAWHVLEHLPGYALDTAMEEIHRILAPGGVLYVKVPFMEQPLTNPDHFRSFGTRSFNKWLPYNGFIGERDTSLQGRHDRFVRARQEVWAYADGFPFWHLAHRLPSLAGGLIERDERTTYARYRSLTGFRERELREWLVKR